VTHSWTDAAHTTLA